MFHKAIDGLLYSIVFLGFYGFFGALWSGLLLLNVESTRPGQTLIYVILAACLTVVSVVQMMREDDNFFRRMDGAVCLAYLGLTVTTLVAFLKPGLLLSSHVLQPFFQVTFGILAAIFIGLVVSLVGIAFRETN